MTYDIILYQGEERVKIRIKLPYYKHETNRSNSRWHLDADYGGAMKFSNGTCATCLEYGPVWGVQIIQSISIDLLAMGECGVSLYNLFSGVLLSHNNGGPATIWEGWGGTTMVPGPATWVYER